MQIYQCYIPRDDIHKVRFYRAIVLSKFNKKLWKENPELTPGQIERKLAQLVRDRHKDHAGAKSVLTILQELNIELEKEGY
jgi:hypothetical protein